MPRSRPRTITPGPAEQPHPRPRRRRHGFGRIGAAATVVSAIVLAIALSSCGGGANGGGKVSNAPVVPSLYPNRTGPETIFTDGSVADFTPATLDELKGLGVDEIDVYMHWADIAPGASSPRRPPFDPLNPAAYFQAQWAPFDAAIEAIVHRDFKLDLALVPPPPLWAAGKGAPDPAKTPQWEPSAVQFGQWVHAVGERYSGHYKPLDASHPLPRVHFWSIWNEPNFGSDLAPQAIDHGQVEVSPRIYRGLLGAAWKALHATGHGHDTMLFGELAPAGVTGPGEPHDFNMMAGLRFLRALYCVDSSLQPLTGSAAAVRGCPATASASARFRAANPALFEASGLADHPYGFGLAPDQLSVGEPDYTNLAAIPKLESTLDSLQQAYGSQRKLPIWSTEFGYLTRPPDPDPAAFPPKTAAYYINWAEYLTWLDPRIQSYDQYLLKDPPDGLFSTGLETANGAPKPAFDAFRMPLFLPVRSGPATRPLLVWGGVRPAPVITASDHTTQYVQVQFSSGGGAPFKTLSRVQITNPHGYFEIRQKFASSGQVRLAWTPPGGSTEHSRTAQINLH